MNKLIVFDFDGVLADLKKVHYESLNEALLKHKYNPISLEDHYLKYDGLSTKTKLSMLDVKKADINKIFKDKQLFTIEEVKKLNKDQNIIDCIASCKKTFEHIVVASNAIRNTLVEGLKAIGILEQIDLILSNEDVINGKPDPAIYVKAMAHFGANCLNTVIVEDSPHGLKAAQLSGCRVVNANDTLSGKFKLIDCIEKVMNQERSIDIKWIDKRLNVVIPMAGRGKRFSEAGFKLPKPMIDVAGKPMIQRVVESLNIDAQYHFIVDKTDFYTYGMENVLRKVVPDCNIIKFPRKTAGALNSVLLSDIYINKDEPILIANSDQIMTWNSLDVMYKIFNDLCHAGLITFTDDRSEEDVKKNPLWSFCKTDKLGLVSEVIEKQYCGSQAANTGLYFCKRAGDFFKAAEMVIQKKIRINNEFYVSSAFDWLCKNSDNVVKEFRINNDEFHPVGTPEQLQVYMNKFHPDYDAEKQEIPNRFQYPNWNKYALIK